MEDSHILELLSRKRSKDFTCWSLVNEALEKSSMPPMPEIQKVHGKADVCHPGWRECLKSASSVAVFFRKGLSQHVGFMITEDDVLHLRKKNACIESLESVGNQYTKVEFYEPVHS